MSYKIVAKGRGEDCFRQFFSGWRNVREVSENLYPNSASKTKTIPLVSKYFNEFRRRRYLEEKMIEEPVRRGKQEYTRKTRKFRGTLKPFLEYAKAEKKVVFEPLEGKMLAELVDNPWFLSDYLSINFREYIVNQELDIIKGLKTLFRDSIIYSFFIYYVWSRSKLDIKELEVLYPKNDFYRLGEMLAFDRVIYTKVALTVFGPPFDSMISLYPIRYILLSKKTGLLKVHEIYEVVHEMRKEAKGKRRDELPEVYKRFEEEVQRQKEDLERRSRLRT